MKGRTYRRKSRKSGFRKAVKRVVRSLEEPKYVDSTGGSAIVLRNYPAVHLTRLDVVGRFPTGKGVNTNNLYTGNEYKVTGITFNVVVTVDPGAVKNASARMSIMQFKRDVTRDYANTGVDGTPPADGHYVSVPRDQETITAIIAGDINLFNPVSDKQKFITTPQNRLPIWADGNELHSGIKKKHSWILDTHRVEGDFTSYTKRMRVYMPVNKVVRQILATYTQAGKDTCFPNPTYVMFDAVEWNKLDSTTAVPVDTGITVNWNCRVHYTDCH